MNVPFFVKKIWEYTPKITFSFLDIDSPSAGSRKTHSFVSKHVNEGYIRGYRNGGDWHAYHGKFSPQYKPMTPFRSIDMPPRPAPNSTSITNRFDNDYHKRVCERYYQLETLDGTEYYLCQHGVQVK